MESVEQLAAAGQRLVAAQQASSPLWRMRHLRAAVGHMLTAMRDVASELDGQEEAEVARLARLEPRRSRRDPAPVGLVS